MVSDLLACGARNGQRCTDQRSGKRRRAYTIFCGTAAFERAADDSQGGRWPEVKECKRGGARQLLSCPCNCGASHCVEVKQVYLSMSFACVTPLQQRGGCAF